MSPSLAAIVSLRNLIVIVNAAAAVFLLGVAVAAIRERRRRRATPLNQEEYLDDPALEGSRLERMQAWALAMFALIAVSLPAYWLIEPTRQDAMDDQFVRTAAHQGEELFGAEGENALGCANCHGPEGEGGVATSVIRIPDDDVRATPEGLDDPKRKCAPDPEDGKLFICQVTWEAPSLNDIFLRFSREEIVDIVTYGRPGTPMPAWGVAGGGSKNEQSVTDIVEYIQSIQVTAEKERAANADLQGGRELYNAFCARCHTRHWSYRGTFKGPGFDIMAVPGGGAFGPNLTGGATVRQFPEVADHVEFVELGSDFQVQYGERGIGSGRMPGFVGMLTKDQIRAIVEYERSLGNEQPVPIDEGEEASQ